MGGATSKGISLVPFPSLAQVEKLRLLTCKKKAQKAKSVSNMYIYIYVSMYLCVSACVSTTRNGKNIDSKNKQAKFCLCRGQAATIFAKIFS